MTANSRFLIGDVMGVSKSSTFGARMIEREGGLLKEYLEVRLSRRR